MITKTRNGQLQISGEAGALGIFRDFVIQNCVVARSPDPATATIALMRPYSLKRLFISITLLAAAASMIKVLFTASGMQTDLALAMWCGSGIAICSAVFVLFRYSARTAIVSVGLLWILLFVWLYSWMLPR
jgi:hypothetical protein